jgi:hypothetical protein
MRRAVRRLAKWSVIALGALGLLILAALPFVYPVIATTACPACYGMERAQPRVIVDAGMPPAMRGQLSDNIRSGASIVSAFYGSFSREPIFIACSTEECDRAMGGGGARAVTFSTPFATFIRVSPRGIDPTIIAHEMAHVELHRRIGTWRFLKGAVPAWFDEGVAVVVSNDVRYLKDGPNAAARCLREPADDLPSSRWEWNTRAANEHQTMYADAACAVLRWMERNGGREGFLQAIERVARGRALEP